MRSATCTISVFSRRWLGLTSRYVVNVDGREIARLGRRREAAVDVAAGSHTVTVAYQRLKSRPLNIDLAPGDHARIEMAFDFPGLLKGPVGTPNVRDGLILHRTGPTT